MGNSYVNEVKAAAFPTPEHSYTMDEEIVRKLREEYGNHQTDPPVKRKN
jgi:hypothetical protein